MSRPPLLYLVHRIPFPPNKGDKVRSFNILRELARSHRVFLGTFVDHPDDVLHVERLSEWCEEVCAIRLHPARARLASLRGLLTGEALSVTYYRSGGLTRWARAVVQRHGIRHGLAFSGPMAQYLEGIGVDVRVIDFCDVDSAKWAEYAARGRGPMAWVYGREAQRLGAFELAAAERSRASTFVTQAEAELFRRRAGTAAAMLEGRVHAVQNGVDATYFSPDLGFPRPHAYDGPALVFTGAMDYWPNVDAVSWFVREVLPRLRAERPALRFFIVGMNPAPEVLALAGDAVTVTGTVPDVRPWLAHADVVVAPLRVARGIQNKVLEAMSMGRPVVVSESAATGLSGRDGEDYRIATDAGTFADAVGHLLDDPEQREALGRAARECVLDHYSWQAHLAAFHNLLGADGWSMEPK